MVLHEFILWRGPLGEVNRGALREGKTTLRAVLSIRSLTFRWSVALWQGLLLGMYDALTWKKRPSTVLQAMNEKCSRQVFVAFWCIGLML